MSTKQKARRQTVPAQDETLAYYTPEPALPRGDLQLSALELMYAYYSA